MKKALALSKELSLPLEAITQTFGVLAVRGAGKTNLAACLAEEMFAAGLPFVAIDPVGSWFGLRSSADGKGPGLQIPIFGGRFGDVPLERAGGQLVADLVVDKRLTCVLDVSEFSEGDKNRFLLDFAERLYRRNTEPLHLFLEEADDFIPQRPQREQARLLRAWENIVRRGRARGLGITMLTQRSASLNKNVLTQIETLFVLRTTSPQDNGAIAAWVAYQGGSEKMLATLPGLKSGEAWVWSPAWLGIFERVQIRRRSTFDSGATPKTGPRTRAATLADIDLGAVKAAMATVIERAKQEDPKELRARIGALEAELRTAKAAKPKPARIEVPVLTNDDRKAVTALLSHCDALAELGSQLHTALGKASANRLSPEAAAKPPATTRRERRPPPADHAPRIPPQRTANDKLASGERKVLSVLAQYPSGRSKKQVAILAGYALGGGAFNNYLSALRTKGFIEGRDALLITEFGLQALGSYEPLPTGANLREHWMRQLGKAERSILSALCESYPKPLTKEWLGTATGYQPNGGGFNNALSKLRTLQLIEGRNEMVASAELF